MSKSDPVTDLKKAVGWRHEVDTFDSQAGDTLAVDPN